MSAVVNTNITVDECSINAEHQASDTARVLPVAPKVERGNHEPMPEGNRGSDDERPIVALGRAVDDDAANYDSDSSPKVLGGDDVRWYACENIVKWSLREYRPEWAGKP